MPPHKGFSILPYGNDSQEPLQGLLSIWCNPLTTPFFQSFDFLLGLPEELSRDAGSKLPCQDRMQEEESPLDTDLSYEENQECQALHYHRRKAGLERECQHCQLGGPAKHLVEWALKSS